MCVSLLLLVTVRNGVSFSPLFFLLSTPVAAERPPGVTAQQTLFSTRAPGAARINRTETW